jgi:hypothetical protein
VTALTRTGTCIRFTIADANAAKVKLPGESSIRTIITVNFVILYHLPFHPQHFPSSFIHSFATFKMDTLVAQYSRPMFEKENNNEEDQMDFYNPTPSMSLKFAMPPVAHVRNFIHSSMSLAASGSCMFMYRMFANIPSPT